MADRPVVVVVLEEAEKREDGTISRLLRIRERKKKKTNQNQT
jgi:hypothetical protein